VDQKHLEYFQRFANQQVVDSKHKGHRLLKDKNHQFVQLVEQHEVLQCLHTHL
jgi:hypothetical protein